MSGSKFPYVAMVQDPDNTVLAWCLDIWPYTKGVLWDHGDGEDPTPGARLLSFRTGQAYDPRMLKVLFQRRTELESFRRRCADLGLTIHRPDLLKHLGVEDPGMSTHGWPYAARMATNFIQRHEQFHWLRDELGRDQQWHTWTVIYEHACFVDTQHHFMFTMRFGG